VLSVGYVHPSATPAIYTLSLHDALPISDRGRHELDLDAGLGVGVTAVEELVVDEHADVVDHGDRGVDHVVRLAEEAQGERLHLRSEEHTSELQSRENLVCRLLLEKKKKN